MSTKRHIDEEVDQTLRSLDGMKAKGADDFFYSRLTARMEHREEEDRSEAKADLGFAFSVAAVFMLMILNLAFISFYARETDTEDTLNRTEAVEELASEYAVTAIDLNYYDYFEEE